MSITRTNPCFQAMRKVCEARGLAYAVEDGGKHPKLVVFIGEAKISIAFPCTPSDARSPLNSAAQLRRLIEQATKPENEAAMNHEVVTVLGKDVVKVDYNGHRVVTLRQIDALHGKPEDAAYKQFARHERRYVEGQDFVSVNASEFRNRFPELIGARGGTAIKLFTERGYGKIVKGWNDDLAWALHDAMQDAYFVVREVARSASDGEMMLPESVWRRIGGVMKSVTLKNTEDLRAGVDLVLEEVSRLGREVEKLKGAPVVAAFDLAGTVTSRDIMDMAGISRDGRVRGTTGGVITRAMKDFCLSHGFAAQRAPEGVDPDRRWRFPRQAALDWLTGPTMGGETIRNHIAKSNARRARSGQRQFALVPST